MVEADTAAGGADGTPVVIHVMANAGYVWNAADAHKLRRVHGLVGAMVGGVSVFKQQNNVHGLPLELAEEEVTLALEKGWAVLRRQLNTPELVAYLQANCRKRKHDHMGYCESDEEDDDWDATAPLPPEPEWRGILKEGSRLVLSDTPEELAEAMPLATQAAAAASVPPDLGQQPAVWAWPATLEERHRYWVFRDLHNQGYRITGGSKFGADYLVYPGDPTLYHAQFCVRLVGWRQPLLAANLAAATRGSAMARKHLLLASVLEGEDLAAPVQRPAGVSDAPRVTEEQAAERQAQQQQVRVAYMTLGPVDGFG